MVYEKCSNAAMWSCTHYSARKIYNLHLSAFQNMNHSNLWMNLIVFEKCLSFGNLAYLYYHISPNFFNTFNNLKKKLNNLNRFLDKTNLGEKNCMGWCCLIFSSIGNRNEYRILLFLKVYLMAAMKC